MDVRKGDGGDWVVDDSKDTGLGQWRLRSGQLIRTRGVRRF